MIEFQYITGLLFFLSLILYKFTTIYFTVIFIIISTISIYIYIQNISKQFLTDVQYVQKNPKLLYILLKLKDSSNKDIIDKCNYILFLIQDQKVHDYLSITQLLSEVNILKKYLEGVHDSKLTKEDKNYIYKYISSIVLNISEINNRKLLNEKKYNNKENFIYSTYINYY